MAGIYLHIPFCKQACHYCDFHFSTNLKYRDRMIECLIREIGLQKDFLECKSLTSIYFGGGTPSILSEENFKVLFEALGHHFSWSEDTEITLEANPDDLDPDTLIHLSESPINRLSIGVQSFRDVDLKLMNRAHNGEEALRSMELARSSGFENLSLDLIYGIPDLDMKSWKQNVQEAISLSPEHISAYALTIEPQTAFHHFIQSNRMKMSSDRVYEEQYLTLCEMLAEAGFEHYEVSNFARPGFRAIHNANYWKGHSYLGIGPSAHSFRDEERHWNISNNAMYMKSIEKGELPLEKEKLDLRSAFNEKLMIGLRTAEGINLGDLKDKFGVDVKEVYSSEIDAGLNSGKLKIDGDQLMMTEEGWFIGDSISSDFFILEDDRHLLS